MYIYQLSPCHVSMSIVWIQLFSAIFSYIIATIHLIFLSFTQVFTDELCGKTFLRIKSCVFVLSASTVQCNYKYKLIIIIIKFNSARFHCTGRGGVGQANRYM